MTTIEILQNAKSAKREIANLSENQKNEALKCMANSILQNTQNILKANEQDVLNAQGKISPVMIDRLKLTEQRISAMASSILEVCTLSDPVYNVIETYEHKNGLIIEKTCVPLGVVAIIYESRPNVTADAATLCLKSSNVCVLRVGKEAYLSAKAIVDAMRQGLEQCNVTKNAISLIEDTTRESAYELMTATDYIDLLIPRGGKGLIDACVQNAKVPVIQTGTGICHMFIDESANLDMALTIINNAKTSRPSVCNALEVLLVHKNVATTLLPRLKEVLVDNKIKNGLNAVELRLCEKSAKIIDGTVAGELDFDTEFLDYILAVKIVDGIDEAISHISKHSTHHSESIITNNNDNAKAFTLNVDSTSVYVNASTRFTDGGEFGLGCEMGISTQKLHARGPMGIKELTTYKYIIKGNGQIR
ncbi:MAG: glutamate-5-semialdehyde dehydrogenase [Clostridia bacterium]|nr:glutamate-5-semialdehyde dehydrogenase [Clostridia bacterium]